MTIREKTKTVIYLFQISLSAGGKVTWNFKRIHEQLQIIQLSVFLTKIIPQMRRLCGRKWWYSSKPGDMRCFLLNRVAIRWFQIVLFVAWIMWRHLLKRHLWMNFLRRYLESFPPPCAFVFIFSWTFIIQFDQL